MATHIVLHITSAHPFQSGSQELLSIRRSFDVTLPFLDIGITRIAKLRLAKCHKRTTEDCIEFLLMIERNTGDIDSLKPFLDFLFGMVALALTNIHKQLGIQYLPLQAFVQTVKDLFQAINLHRKLILYKTPQ